MTSLDLDIAEFQRFARAHPQLVARRLPIFLKRAGQFVRAGQVREAAARLGVETGQSRMQHPDPRRPKGFYMNSIRVDVARAMATVGPNVRYNWWVEMGSRAPRGVPRTHRRSQFRGHMIVTRARERSLKPVQAEFESWLADVTRRSTQ